MPALPSMHLGVIGVLIAAIAAAWLSSPEVADGATVAEGSNLLDTSISNPLSALITAQPIVRQIDSRAGALGIATEPGQSQQLWAQQWRSLTIENGDSLSSLFKRNDLSANDVLPVSAAWSKAGTRAKLRIGRKIHFVATPRGDVLAVRYAESPLTTVLLTRNKSAFARNEIVRVPNVQAVTRHAEINSNLFLAGRQAGLPNRLTMALAQIFQWDIDFALDVRKGDQFTVIYEELSLDEKRIGEGKILAAEFVNQGKRYQAVRYTNSSGQDDFYAADGRSMKKAFLRAPLEFSRVSSNFNMRRLHPIRRVVRPHRGTDYAAPQGTPVWAAGDGRVAKVARDSAAGMHVIIDHGKRYQTRYFHLSRFAKQLKVGQQVDQGQVIGYVGSTGLATGPHLHFEFLERGTHKNPRTVPFMADPISKSEMQRFVAMTTPMLASLNQADRNTLAFVGAER